jgi:hypothetical protein
LTARGWVYVVQVNNNLTAHPADAVPQVKPYTGRGRHPLPRYRTPPVGLREHPLAAGRDAAVEVTWRQGSRGPLTSSFVALRVRPAGRKPTARLAADGSLPAVWLLAEWPPEEPEPTDYWLATLPADTPLPDLVRLVKIRWQIEHDYRECKTALGLDHFEELVDVRRAAVFPAPSGDWSTVPPAVAGWRPELLDHAVDVAMRRRSTGVIFLVRGRIMVERYDHGGSEAFAIDVASVQKSVISVLIGIAQRAELLGVDDRVARWLGPGWSQADPSLESRITIRHLMSMTSGPDEQLRFIHPAGSTWFYNTPAFSDAAFRPPRGGRRAASGLQRAGAIRPNRHARRGMATAHRARLPGWAHPRPGRAAAGHGSVRAPGAGRRPVGRRPGARRPSVRVGVALLVPAGQPLVGVAVVAQRQGIPRAAGLPAPPDAGADHPERAGRSRRRARRRRTRRSTWCRAWTSWWRGRAVRPGVPRGW